MSALKPNPAFIEGVAEADRKRWAEALLRAEADPNVWQAHGRMLVGNQHGKGMCCLMVAHEEWGGTRKQRDCELPARHSPLKRVLGSQTGLGPNINPRIAINDDPARGRVGAAETNDDYKLTFTEIAALIWPEGLA